MQAFELIIEAGLRSRCWVNRLQYDEARYLLVLQKRQASLLKVAASIPT
jgi:hypothetical protein